MGKRLPAYSTRLPARPRFAFITAEWSIGRRIVDLGGPCLVCPDDPERYDLSALSGAEAWVLFLRDESAARRLAAAVARVAAGGYLIPARGLQ